MSSLSIGCAGIVALLVLIAIRVPIGVAIGAVSLIGISVLRGPDAALIFLGTMSYDFAASWELSAVPMFLLMGSIAYHTGLTASLFSAARLWLAFLPGGLAVATNFAAAGFAAASGSSLATAAAMGRLAIPEMLRFRYDPALATSVVAAAGTLGSLIPPSILMVLFGWYTETPVGALLIAGILPGILTAVIYAGMLIMRCTINPELAPPITEGVDWRARWDSLLAVWPIPLIILAVIGGIYGGITTPTEAGAFGASIVALIALVQRRLSWKVLWESVGEALSATAGILFIAIGAILLTRFLALSGVPFFMANLIEDWAVDPLLLIIATSIIYVVLGMFLDAIGLMLLTLPVLQPMFEAVGLDMVWVGVLVIKYLEIALLTPPVGLNAYVVKGVVGDAVPLTTIFRGLLWFLGAEVIIVVLLIAFPQISLYLPSLMARGY